MDNTMARIGEQKRETGHERSEAVSACPLCGSHAASVVDVLTYDEIRTLWRTIGVSLSERALSSLGSTGSIALRRCSGCGLEWFPPEMAGVAAFYEELESQFANYYPETCPGFERALAFAERHRLERILDIGCGDGAFLDQASGAGLNAHGIELNPRAAEKAANKGHDVYSETIEALLAREHPPRFDLVTAFEVVEHVPDPVGFVRQAARLVNPGGFFAVTVPNRHGVHWLCQLEPHQWPPHHVTRWRAKDLRALAERSDLEVTKIGGDRLLGGEIERYVGLQRQFRQALGRGGGVEVPLLAKLVSFAYRKTGCKFVFPGWGASLYGFFQRI